ncbi:MAG: hypothetical protein LBQ68_10595 [Clostridiales bacterium]|nr:hypothetical protein [Clostridiales bacterium]
MNKKFLIGLVCAVFLFNFTACGGTDPDAAVATDAPSSEVTQSEEPADTSAETLPLETNNNEGGSGASPDMAAGEMRIGFAVQEYEGSNIAEIPKIEYGGDNIPEIDYINDSIKNGLQEIYNGFKSGNSTDEWVEIRSYPFTSDDYLQVVVTTNFFPSYGTDGDLFSINYDRKNNHQLTITEAFNATGITFENLKDKVSEVYEPENEGDRMEEVNATSFVIKDGEYILLVEIYVFNESGEPYKAFYSFDPVNGVLTRLDKDRLFDPSELDQTDPPLKYAQS